MSPDNKYINLVYRMMLNDLESRQNIVNWASLVKHLLLSLGFYEVWLAQGVGNYNAFITIFKQRLTDTFIQNWHSRFFKHSNVALNFCIVDKSYHINFNTNI